MGLRPVLDRAAGYLHHVFALAGRAHPRPWPLAQCSQRRGALVLAVALLGWAQPCLAQEAGRDVIDRAESQRRDLRVQQNVLTRPESNQADRRLDAIENRARTNPGAAQDMLRIYQQDQSLNTINRPIPGAPPPQAGGMVGPGDRH